MARCAVRLALLLAITRISHEQATDGCAADSSEGTCNNGCVACLLAPFESRSIAMRFAERSAPG